MYDEPDATIIDTTHNANTVLEELEASRAFFTIYEGGIFLHQGRTYLVKEMNPERMIAKVEYVKVDWTTQQRDYTDIDPTFGSLADVDALIAGLHERGMKLVMDLVVNHTSDEHPWFVESRDPQSPKRDWYFWRPARPGCAPGTEGAEPTRRRLKVFFS